MNIPLLYLFMMPEEALVLYNHICTSLLRQLIDICASRILSKIDELILGQNYSTECKALALFLGRHTWYAQGSLLALNSEIMVLLVGLGGSYEMLRIKLRQPHARQAPYLLFYCFIPRCLPCAQLIRIQSSATHMISPSSARSDS